MRAVIGQEWGADKEALMYRALMRLTIDYGYFVYGAAAKTHLNKIDRVQNKALRICSVAMKSTPTKAIQVEQGGVPILLTYMKNVHSIVEINLFVLSQRQI